MPEEKECKWFEVCPMKYFWEERKLDYRVLDIIENSGRIKDFLKHKNKKVLISKNK